MRTTLDLDDDVLHVARDVARHNRTSVGKVVSDLARSAIAGGAATAAIGFESESELYRRLRELGVVPLPRTGIEVTSEMVNRIRDDEGI